MFDPKISGRPLMNENNTPEAGSVLWESPSNIALVKYWGKSEGQIPENPSVSFTLSKAKTTTRLDWEKKSKPGSEVDFSFYFHGIKKPEFLPKLKIFFSRIKDKMPFLTDYYLRISSENNFPHSSGIASSASGMSALAAALTDMGNQIGQTQKSTEDHFRRYASEISRSGSGSACRSFFPYAALWGKSDFPGSSDLFAIGIEDLLHPLFQNYHDAILLIERSPKPVTSTAGHHLMTGNPYAPVRYSEARKNTQTLLQILQTGDLEAFVKIVETEALTLHALMMTSDPGYILMHPRTIEAIHLIQAFRRDTGIPLCFTLDAGPNIHLLYPGKHVSQVHSFIEDQLKNYCQDGKWIADKMGEGTKISGRRS